MTLYSVYIHKIFITLCVCTGVSSEEQGMLVKQGFPFHGRGVVGQLQDPFLANELSRVITSHGAVIRYMRDGSTEVNILYIHVHVEATHAQNRAEPSRLLTQRSRVCLQVLFADGSVSFSRDSGPVWVPDSEVGEENASQETDNKEGAAPVNAENCFLYRLMNVMGLCWEENKDSVFCVCPHRAELREGGRCSERVLDNYDPIWSTHLHCGYHTQTHTHPTPSGLQDYRPHHP